jgi:hypothetical protein
MHTLALELLCEVSSCPDYSKSQAIMELGDAVAALSTDPDRCGLRLRLGLRRAITMGDYDTMEALEYLDDLYSPVKDSASIAPIDHVRIRNTLGIFQRQYSPQQALVTWQSARVIIERKGLAQTQEALRLAANLAAHLESSDPRQAAAINADIFARQLASFGIEHHLTLWAAINYLQCLIVAGMWDEALTLIRKHLRLFREVVVCLPPPSTSLFAASFRPTREDVKNVEQLLTYGSSLPLSADALYQLNRMHHIVAVTVDSYFSQPPPKDINELCVATLVLLELLQFAKNHLHAEFAALDRVLRRADHAYASRWPEVQARIRCCYLELDGRVSRDIRTRLSMRRMAVASLGKLTCMERIFLTRTAKRRGLPTASL